MRFGFCTNLTQCDWHQYERHLVWNGLPSFILAVVLIALMAVYTSTLCCRYRPILSPSKTTTRWVYSFIKVTYGMLVTAALLLGFAGFSLTILGWFDTDLAYNRAWQLYDTGIDALQQMGVQVNAFLQALQQVLSFLQDAVVTHIGELDAVPQFTSVLNNIQAVVENVNDVRTAVNLLMAIYRWLVLPVATCSILVLVVFAIAGFIRTQRNCLLVAISLGFIINLGCWVAAAATLIGESTVSDVCSDIWDVQHNPELLQSWGLMFSNSSLEQDTLVVLHSLVEDGKEAAIRTCQLKFPQCIGSVTPCAAYPLLCKAIQGLDVLMVLMDYAAAKDCNCTLQWCASQCHNPLLASTAQLLVISLQTIDGLKGPVGTLLSLQDTAPTFYDGLFRNILSICRQGSIGFNFLACGLTLLGSAGFMGLLCLGMLEVCTRSLGKQTASMELQPDTEISKPVPPPPALEAMKPRAAIVEAEGPRSLHVDADDPAARCVSVHEVCLEPDLTAIWKE
eukprot:GGOE01045610.1.p1 GENE.GGOE01045610.1~~GGOE01045610.1.p1  ORF type:complete len:507 (-),score=90.98 GGOE01045610.1:408-1928(-)